MTSKVFPYFHLFSYVSPKTFTFFWILFSTPCISLLGQEIVFHRHVKLKSFLEDKRKVIPIYNASQENLALLLMDNRKIHGWLIDRYFKFSDSIFTKRPKSVYNHVTGYTSEDSDYHLFFLSGDKNKLCIQSLNFETKSTQKQYYNWDYNKEDYLETISNGNTFYLFNRVRKTTQIKIYEFVGNELKRIGTIDLASSNLSEDQYAKLSESLRSKNNNRFDLKSKRLQPQKSSKRLQLKQKLKFQKIDTELPNSIDQSAEAIKIYQNQNQAFITFDTSFNHTLLVTINLEDLTHTIKFYDQLPFIGNTEFSKKSNSYLYQNTLFQIRINQDELGIKITDTKTDLLRKQINLTPEELVKFKNTPYHQSGGTTIYAQGQKRELGKTKQFLRKLLSSKIGVSIRPYKEYLEIAIGGYKEVKRGSGSPFGGMGMGFGNEFGGIPLFFGSNMTMSAYYSAVNSRSVYFKSILEKNTFDRVETKVSANVFEKIEAFEEKNNSEVPKSSKTIFRIGDLFYFGCYMINREAFYLRRFTQTP